MKPLVLFIALAILGAAVFAQAPAQQPSRPAGKLDPGVAPVRLLDRPDVRVLRTEVEAGAVRSPHTHDDVKFHLFLPLTPGIELTIGSQPPVATMVGQAYYLKKGELHGFRNTGSSKGMILEVFVKQDAPAAERDALGAAFLALAASR